MRKPEMWLVIVVGLVVIAGLRCGADKTSGPEPDEFVIVPDSTAVEVSSSQQFVVDYAGESPDVVWSVNGVGGGSAETGVITGDGLYIAPAGRPAVGSVTVGARSVSDPGLTATAKVDLIKTVSTPYVVVEPDTAIVAVTDSVRLSGDAFGCPSDEVTWSIEVARGDPLDTGTMRPDGTYLAPSSLNIGFSLFALARSQSCTDKTGVAFIILKAPIMFTVQMEAFTDSSGVNIKRGVACGGGYGVSGLDTPGEWITIPVNVPAGGHYEAEIHYAAGIGDILTLRAAAEGCGMGDVDPSADFVLDLGTGVGT
jgi:hypothetical protein